jgi:adenosine deaminase
VTNGSLTLEAALDRLLKVELHCHVEGTIRPATLVP